MAVGLWGYGLLHTILAVKSGAYVICSDVEEEHLNLATQLGAHVVVNPLKEDLRKDVMAETKGVGAQIVFDTTPSYQVAEEAVDLLAQLGVLVFYSSFYPDKPVSYSPDRLHKRGLKIVGTANSNSRDFVRATQLISRGIVDVKPFISNTYPFEKIETAMEEAAAGGKYRVVVKMKEVEKKV